MQLPQDGLVFRTWGNVSGLDKASGVLAIKPSGVPYGELSAENMVLVDLDGHVVEGDLNPSSDKMLPQITLHSVSGLHLIYGRTHR